MIHPLPEWRSRRERLRHRSRVANLAAALNPDLYHVHEPELLGPVIYRSGSRPVIWDVHESYLDVLMDRRWIPRWMRPLARSAWDLRERTLIRRCAGVVAATERVAERYRAFHDNVVTVANYPDLNELEALPPVSRDAATCVYAGAIVPNRGLPRVFAALALLRGRGLTVRLALAGRCDEHYLRALFGELERLGVRDLVCYHGVLTKRDALLLQQAAGIGLIPGLPVGNNLAAVPVKMVECMALGLPVIFSDFPSHREVAGLSGAGIAIDPTSAEQIADAIERLVKNPDLACRMGENGIRAVRERFNWGVERAKLLDLYRTILRPLSAG
jgi:glycosyltransferase involved in cell wall biosynthesis